MKLKSITNIYKKISIFGKILLFVILLLIVITFNSTFSYVKRINSKYFIYLPDDVILVDDFFNKVKDAYESIPDQNKICLIGSKARFII